MRADARKLHGDVRGGSARIETCAAVVRSAPDLLTRPTFHNGVAAGFTQSGPRLWAKFLLCWIEAGGKVEGAPDAPVDLLVTRTLEKWAGSVIGEMANVAGLDLLLGDSCSALGLSGWDSPEDRPHVIFGYAPTQQPPWRYLKQPLLRLEEACPGLGKLALWEIERAGAMTAGIFSPDTAQIHAQHIWWFGTDNDADAYAEICSCNDITPEQVEQEGYRMPSEWDRAFPDWILRRRVCGPTRKPAAASRAAIGILAQAMASADPFVRRVAEIVEHLASLEGQLPSLGGTDNEQVYFGAYLRWDAADPLVDLLDDFINYANGAADCYTELFGAAPIYLETDQIRKWKGDTERAFEAYATLNELLGLVTTSD